MPELKLITNDPWLQPFSGAIEGRLRQALSKEQELTAGGETSLFDFADGHLYFGLHHTPQGWVFREWAPNATAICLIGDFNGWQRGEGFWLNRIENGVWEIRLPDGALQHGQLYKLWMEWEGGAAERIPAWCRRVVQDEQTHIFSAQIWCPEKPYVFKQKKFKPDTSPLLIYECHIGMADRNSVV